MRGSAYFVKKPSRLNNLLKPHRIEEEVPYEVVKTILLSQIDYENFATDLSPIISQNQEKYKYAK